MTESEVDGMAKLRRMVTALKMKEEQERALNQQNYYGGYEDIYDPNFFWENSTYAPQPTHFVPSRQAPIEADVGVLDLLQQLVAQQQQLIVMYAEGIDFMSSKTDPLEAPIEPKLQLWEDQSQQMLLNQDKFIGATDHMITQIEGNVTALTKQVTMLENRIGQMANQAAEQHTQAYTNQQELIKAEIEEVVVSNDNDKMWESSS